MATTHDTAILIPRTDAETDIYQGFFRNQGPHAFVGGYEGDGWFRFTCSNDEIGMEASGRIAIVESAGGHAHMLINWREISVSNRKNWFDGTTIDITTEWEGQFHPAMIMSAVNAAAQAGN